MASQVPAKYKSKGTLTVATEAQYAPVELLASNGHTIIGLDPDLVSAIAETMGLKARFSDGQFEAIIPGIQAGRYDRPGEDRHREMYGASGGLLPRAKAIDRVHQWQ